MTRCSATTKSGLPCINDSRYGDRCLLHAGVAPALKRKNAEKDARLAAAVVEAAIKWYESAGKDETDLYEAVDALLAHRAQEPPQ